MKYLIILLVLVSVMLNCDLYNTNDTVDLLFTTSTIEKIITFDRIDVDSYIANLNGIDAFKNDNTYFFGVCDISVTHSNNNCNIYIEGIIRKPTETVLFDFSESFECSRIAWKKYKKDYGITELKQTEFSVTILNKF